MPQVFMIVSERGIEYGFAASIHPSDFSTPTVQQRVRTAAPKIFAALPLPGSPMANALKADLERSAGWFFRRKTRLNPFVNDYSSVDEWLSFLKTPDGARWAGGSISRYLTEDDLNDQDLDLPSLVEAAAENFLTLMATVTPTVQPRLTSISVQEALSKFLDRYNDVRVTTSFGQHDELKNLLNGLRAALEQLSSSQAHPHIRISWSLGAGNWARIPWIAFMDERETTSTQRGTYCVFLFREDMSGVYLTLAQGVTNTIEQHGRSEGRRVLSRNAIAIRALVGSQLSPRFVLDDNMDLQTDGTLGQDYEAGAIAYRFYTKGEVPPDAEINDDLRILLSAYEQVLDHRPAPAGTDHQFWIFQSDPKIFDIDAALGQLSELAWAVENEADKSAAVGDRVFLWRAGAEAGVVALAAVVGVATRQAVPTNERPFVVDAKKLGDLQPRVTLRIQRVLTEPLLRTTIAADARLNDLAILRFATHSTFKISQHHADALAQLFEDSVDTAPQEKAKVEHTVWLYAPGENAEHWDEFYANGLMGIGWNDLAGC